MQFTLIQRQNLSLSYRSMTKKRPTTLEPSALRLAAGSALLKGAFKTPYNCLFNSTEGKLHRPAELVAGLEPCRHRPQPHLPLWTRVAGRYRLLLNQGLSSANLLLRWVVINCEPRLRRRLWSAWSMAWVGRERLRWMLRVIARINHHLPRESGCVGHLCFS